MTRFAPAFLFDLDGTRVDSVSVPGARELLSWLSDTDSYGPDELRQSGAIRVFDDPADLLSHIDELGGRR